MRLWSIHPKHLDAKGLVALWREGLLARAVLLGKTVGYRRHPQLERFRRRSNPIAAIDAYLHHVAEEAGARGYRFDRHKIGGVFAHRPSPVHAGQLAYEWSHLLSKLRKRDPARWNRERRAPPSCHPCFRVVPGEVEPWERRNGVARRPARKATQKLRAAAPMSSSKTQESRSSHSRARWVG